MRTRRPPARGLLAAARRQPLPALLLLGLGIAAVGAGGIAWSNARRVPADDAPRLTLSVDGLDCAFWCAVRLTDSVDRLDGAIVESVDRRTGAIVVRHDPARQTTANVQRAIAAAGFTLRERPAADLPADQR
ncbi:MAG: heavy-metal-associated domain-containing protein [Planctomycetes bacterium]|nr:heavy-metal-associated domain-containing protein [Planctomycetota bacterium]